MIGEKIKELRVKNNMTQKNLADRLFVTAQAVSRWEKGEVEPSLSTVAILAQIFGVSTDEIIGVEKTVDEKSANNDAKESHREPERNPIARCTYCYGDIYDNSDIIRVRSGDYAGIKCRKCAEELITQIVEDREVAVRNSRLICMRSARIKSIVAIILLAILPTIGVIASSSSGLWLNVLDWVLSYLVLFYPISAALGTLFLRNVFIGRLANQVLNFWPLVFDKEGRFTGVKKALFISFPGKIVKIISFPAAVITYVVVSPFVFPYAIYKSFKNVYEYYEGIEFWENHCLNKEDLLKFMKDNPEEALTASNLYLLTMGDVKI